MKHLYIWFIFFGLGLSAFSQKDTINKNAITLHVFDMPQVVGIGYHRLLLNSNPKYQLELAASLSRASASGKLDSESYLHYGIVPTLIIGNQSQIRFTTGLGLFLQQDFANQTNFLREQSRPPKYRILPHGRVGLRFDKPENMFYFHLGLSTGFIREEKNVLKDPDQIWFKTSYLLFVVPGISFGFKF